MGDCIVVAPEADDIGPAPRGERAGLFSASRWISALPGIGTLFSPNRTTFPPVAETPIAMSASQPQTHSQSPENSGSTGRKRKTPTQLARSYSEPQLATGTVTRSARTRSQNANATPAVGRSSKRQRLSQTRSEPVVVIESDDDEEDPLLLSPESARRRQAEERAEREERERAEREALDSESSPHGIIVVLC